MNPSLRLHLIILNVVTCVYACIKSFRHLLLRWRQQRHSRYAIKYGQRRANQLIPLQSGEYQTDFSPLPDKEMGLCDPEFYADTWPAMLKVALGLYTIDADLMKYAGRWLFFKWAMLGFLLDWEVIHVEDICSAGRKE